MKIATFNIQNLFHRDKSLLEKPYGKNLNDWINELDALMLHPSKSLNQVLVLMLFYEEKQDFFI